LIFLKCGFKMADEPPTESAPLNAEAAKAEHRAERPRVIFDDVLKELGEFGPYQRKIYFILFLVPDFANLDFGRKV
jgi:hypothetical protein